MAPWLKRWKHWLHGLVGGVIGGVATAVSAVAGTAAVGHPLDWTQIKAVAISAAVMGAAAYLKQSPLPPEECEDENAKVVR